MRIGISTSSYFPNLYTEQAIGEIAESGCGVCEVFLASHYEYRGEFGEVLQDSLAKARKVHALEVHSIHTLTNQFEPDLFNRGDKARADAFDAFNKACKVGQMIGAKHYTFHGPTLLKRAVKYTFDYPRLATTVNRLVEIAASYGLRFCYENVHWTYCSTPTYFDNIKRLCPDLGAVLDIKQAMQSGIDWREFLKVQKDRLCTVHVCDYDDKGLAIPGRGSFDFVEFFARLMDAGYDGPCLMEVYDKNYDDIAQLKDSYLYLCDCLDRAQHK